MPKYFPVATPELGLEPTIRWVGYFPRFIAPVVCHVISLRRTIS